MSHPIASRPLKDRLTKVPSWFRPKTEQQAAMAQAALRGIQKQQETKERGLAAMRNRLMPKAAELIRHYDARSRDFLGGGLSPWTADAWRRIRAAKYKRQHPYRHFVWQITGLLSPF